MTERQQEALKAIQAFTGEHGYPPTYRQLGEMIGLSSPGSVCYVVRALKRDGKLEYESSSPRTLTIPENGSYIPELIIDWEEIPAWWSVMDDNFAGPPGKQRYAHFHSRKEAEAYRQGWYDGFSGE